MAYEGYFSGKMHDLSVSGIFSGGKAPVVNANSEITQFYKDMRFNHNDISYYINTGCSWSDSSKMKEAFDVITEDTGNLITFYSSSEDSAEILIGCSANAYEKEENIFIAGEGGPTKIVNSSMPVITRGKVLLYNESGSSCREPILELHELFHVFGYDHLNDKNSVMYPYLNCKQEIGSDLIEHMKKLYSIEPYAELQFINGSAYKERYLGKWYLNFNISINNDGIIDAQNVALEVYSNTKLIKEFKLADVKFGEGLKYTVKNLQIDSENSEIKIKAKTSSREPDTSNNELVLKV